MLRKINNKTLFILAVMLAVVETIAYIYDRRQGDRTFRTDLFSVDSATVTAIKIYPKGSTGEPLTLARSGKSWEIRTGNRSYPADSGAISNILSSLAHVTAEHVAASDAAGWKPLEINDSLGRHVVVEQGSSVAADFMVGKASFIQDQGMQNRRGNRGFSVKSHIRLAGDDHVYVVDGFLSMVFSDQPAQYRNRMICRFEPQQVTKLTFIYPGDSSFILSRTGSAWTVSGKPADSAKTATYLASISGTYGSEFEDEEKAPVTFPFTLRIEGNNMAIIEVNGATVAEGKIHYIRSTANTQAVFRSSDASLFNRVFASKNKF